MAMDLITTNPDSTNVASVEFTSGIDSTYKVYIFKFYDVNPATDNVEFFFEGSIDGGSNYGITKTTGFFEAYQEEDAGSPSLSYKTAHDETGATDPQTLFHDLGNAADDSVSGELFLFSPSNPYSLTLRQFFGTFSGSYITSADPASVTTYIGGYFDHGDAINAVKFKMSSGNMDGVIKMYGVK